MPQKMDPTSSTIDNMSNNPDAAYASLGQVPLDQRDSILSGMRWSVWLSVLAVPFSAGANLILARVGPETIGTYGLLSVYIGLVSAIVYFGGDTVVIRFIPECKLSYRLAFTSSYCLVIFVSMAFWLSFAYLYPAGMRLILGTTSGDRFHFVILCLAPVPILFSLIVASLKGILDIRFAQALVRLLPIISFFVYGAMFLLARPLLSNHPTAVVWTLYLGLTALLTGIGALRLIRLCGRPETLFYLPHGFWRYSFATQQVSIVSFLRARIDYVLILNFGGLAALGRYVAIMTVASVAPMVSTFFMETLLPSLVNLLAARNQSGAVQVFRMHMRILFLVATAVSCGVMLLAVPATSLMGTKYLSIRSLIVLMTLLQGVGSPGMFGGTLLASVGRQDLAARVGVLHLVLFTLLFVVGWHQWNLAGAVLAAGLALLASNTILMAVSLRTAAVYPSIFTLWFKAVAIQTLVAFIALRWMPLGIASAIATWLGSIMLFLLLGGYGKEEFLGLAETFLPTPLWKLNPFLPAATPVTASSNR